MQIGMMLFRAALGTGWVGLLFVSVHAANAMGLGAAGAVFVGDFAHPWRAQFNTDFSLYLLLAAAWMVYRARSPFLGLICAMFAIALGGLFTLAYLLAATFQARGDMRRVLLGNRAASA
jgi:hypothetical protein